MGSLNAVKGDVVLNRHGHVDEGVPGKEFFYDREWSAAGLLFFYS